MVLLCRVLTGTYAVPNCFLWSEQARRKRDDSGLPALKPDSKDLRRTDVAFTANCFFFSLTEKVRARVELPLLLF